MSLVIKKVEYNVKIVLFDGKKMEYITVAGPFRTMEEADMIKKQLQEEITLDKGFLSLSETMYCNS